MILWEAACSFPTARCTHIPDQLRRAAAGPPVSSWVKSLGGKSSSRELALPCWCAFWVAVAVAACWFLCPPSPASSGGRLLASVASGPGESLAGRGHRPPVEQVAGWGVAALTMLGHPHSRSQERDSREPQQNRGLRLKCCFSTWATEFDS